MTSSNETIDVIIDGLSQSNRQILDDLLLNKYDIKSSSLSLKPEIINEDQSIQAILNSSLYLKGIEYINREISNIFEEEEKASNDDNKMTSKKDDKGDGEEEDLTRTFKDILDRVGPDDVNKMTDAITDLPKKQQDALMKMYYDMKDKKDTEQQVEESFKSLKDITYNDLSYNISELPIKYQNFIINTIYEEADIKDRNRIIEAIILKDDLNKLTLNETILSDIKLISELYYENADVVKTIYDDLSRNINESEDQSDVNVSNITLRKFEKYIK